MWTEFKPAIRFLLIFIGIYIGGNVVYGLWINSFDGTPDTMTYSVTKQTAAVLNTAGYGLNAMRNTQGPTVFLRNENKTILNIYEGCNGINVMIVFVSFLLAFGGSARKLSWFAPAGLVIIHLANIARIVLLYFVAIEFSNYFYYVHKYVFTAIIYLIVFLLWAIWVIRINARRGAKA